MTAALPIDVLCKGWDSLSLANTSTQFLYALQNIAKSSVNPITVGLFLVHLTVGGVNFRRNNYELNLIMKNDTKN